MHVDSESVVDLCQGWVDGGSVKVKVSGLIGCGEGSCPQRTGCIDDQLIQQANGATVAVTVQFLLSAL